MFGFADLRYAGCYTGFEGLKNLVSAQNHLKKKLNIPRLNEQKFVLLMRSLNDT